MARLVAARIPDTVFMAKTLPSSLKGRDSGGPLPDEVELRTREVRDRASGPASGPAAKKAKTTN